MKKHTHAFLFLIIYFSDQTTDWWVKFHSIGLPGLSNINVERKNDFFFLSIIRILGSIRSDVHHNHAVELFVHAHFSILLLSLQLSEQLSLTRTHARPCARVDSVMCVHERGRLHGVDNLSKWKHTWFIWSVCNDVVSESEWASQIKRQWEQMRERNRWTEQLAHQTAIDTPNFAKHSLALNVSLFFNSHFRMTDLLYVYNTHTCIYYTHSAL